MMRYNWKLYTLFAFVLFVNCGSSSSEIDDLILPPSDRVIQFSGMDWIVRTTKDKREGPGPNLFSDSDKNVWLDEKGRLHLKIRQEAGHWYCAGVTAKKSMGYGKYVFYINSDITLLDQHVVAGFFTYLHDEEEIDIEFSKWSIPTNENSQFAIQPADLPGNKERFNIAPELGQTVHSFDWQAGDIRFRSGYQDDKGVDQIISEWNYSGKHVPREKNEKLKMNLWLFKGQMPSDLKEQEIVIDSVRFKAK